MKTSFAALLFAASCLTLGCMDADPGRLLPPTADQDPALPQRSITVAGSAVAIHTETFGDPTKPALFVLHDALADYRAYSIFESLSDRYFVVMWDRRGEGLSERFSDETYSPETLVEEIDALKAIHSPGQPITLIGHGFGGTYAALYMARKPDAVRQAVLIEPVSLNSATMNATYGTLFDDSTWSATISKMLWQGESMTPLDHESVDYKALLYRADPGWNHYHCNQSAPPAFPIWRPGGYVEILRREMFLGEDDSDDQVFHYDFAAGLDKFPAKVSILVSECSALGYDFQNTHHRALFQTAEISVIMGAGHDMFLEKPTDVITAVTSYLSEY